MLPHMMRMCGMYFYMYMYVYSQDGIEPMWEDKKNKNGGRWLFNLEKRDRRELLDHLWLETVSSAYL